MLRSRVALLPCCSRRRPRTLTERARVEKERKKGQKRERKPKEPREITAGGETGEPKRNRKKTRRWEAPAQQFASPSLYTLSPPALAVTANTVASSSSVGHCSPFKEEQLGASTKAANVAREPANAPSSHRCSPPTVPSRRGSFGAPQSEARKSAGCSNSGDDCCCCGGGGGSMVTTGKSVRVSLSRRANCTRSNARDGFFSLF